ncbi:MAG TPA: right-handed parallel beta-helix repeat-containing protein [Solirubrobacterales bacterium]|nr:right-handed parallel beta-helix repeat-containing protein [Solirubrobacterales bacterium]
MTAIVSAIAVLLLWSAISAPAASAADYHLDCQAAVNGDGSEPSPFNSPGVAGTVNLGAGDRLLLKRGSTCNGQLAPQGGGSPAGPATVGAYGTGSDPRIVGTGTNALLIADMSHLVVQDLDISNPGSGEPLGEATTLRNGVMVSATTGEVRDLTLRRLNVHDVAGDLTKNPQGSAGIQVSALGPPPARFENLTIEANTITSVSRSGISITGTNDANRPAASTPWAAASQDVRIRGNRIDLMAGDGIVTRGTDGAVIEDNVVSRGNLSGRGPFDPGGAMCNAGIWAFRANNTLIQRNEVFGMEHNGCDGTGFDIDYFQDGTIVQFNYSHDNTGGFVLLCSDDASRSGDVRFNLSVNDSTTISHGPCGIASGVVGTLSGLRFFNNTIVAPRPSASVLGGPTDTMLLPGDFEFRNNIVYALDPGSPAMACGDFCSHNLFYGLPSAGSEAVEEDPELIDPLATGSGFGVAENFRLGNDSRARQAGIAIENPGPGDFFGRPTDPGAAPSIGFDQPPPVIHTEPPPVDRSKCRRATALHRKAVGKLRIARRQVAKLRRVGKRPRIARAKRKVAKLKREAAKRKRAKRAACSR